jgi:hypothetical protein
VLIDHYLGIARHRNAVQEDTEVGASKDNILRIFDALLQLLKHADHADRRLREHLNEHEDIRPRP